MSGGNDRGGCWRVLLCARCNALCACPSVSFSLGRVWETENGRAAGMTSACRGGHGGETRRVKVGGGCGPQRGQGVSPEILDPRRPSTPPAHPPPKEDIRAEGQRMEEVQRETYSSKDEGTVGRVPDAQMQRGAMPHSCQKLGATSTKLFSPPKAASPPITPSIFTHQTTLCLWCTLPSCFLLMPEADETTEPT